MARPPTPTPAPLLLLFFFLPLLILTTPTHITIPLTPSINLPSSSDPFQMLSHLAFQSLSRARHLKYLNPTTTPTTATSLSSSSSIPTIKTPLFPRSYGGHSIPLRFGTPSQITTFVMDTGSSLVWFPCTSRYLCFKCNFSQPTAVPTFIPKLSSSSKLVDCKNSKCAWIFGPEILSKCPTCGSSQPNCTLPPCPPYVIEYGLGSTAGLLLSETLDFPETKIQDFLVGCSILSTRQPEGIAGFGRSKESLPFQLGLKRFSYCLVSHRYDDAPLSSDLVLDPKGAPQVPGVNYTPFRQNPNSANAAFKEYYYVNLRRIIIGEKIIKIPHVFAAPGLDGNGGTIVDSGSTFTYMEKPLFGLVSHEFEKQMKNYTVAKDVENRTGLRPCFRITGKTVEVPGLVFQFKGGAKMEFALSNYFVLVGLDAACLIIVTDDVVGPGVRGGPSVILGNYQQMNFYVEYDLENRRFGFKRQNCLSSS